MSFLIHLTSKMIMIIYQTQSKQKLKTKKRSLSTPYQNQEKKQRLVYDLRNIKKMSRND